MSLAEHQMGPAIQFGYRGTKWQCLRRQAAKENSWLTFLLIGILFGSSRMAKQIFQKLILDQIKRSKKC